jgi:acetylornithine/N-succinyldiaminopimelate aminotransferase
MSERRPGVREEIVRRERAALMPNYRRLPVELVRGEGVYLYDHAGRAYLDCIAGISVSNLGHCHPDVVAAIRAQAGRLIHCSNLFYTEPMIELAEWIRDRSLGGKVFFCNSGTEANEAALKLVRKHAGPSRPEIVALVNSFHGRTYGALSITGQAAKQDAFRPLLPGVRFVEPDDAAGLEAAVGERTAAIVVEIIQGEIGVHPLDPGFLRLARALADRYGALLVVDEIQTGLSRTGTLFAYQGVGVEPDVMSLAKSLGGGMPIGAIVARPELSDVFQPGEHGSTFAGSPLACAAGLAACRALEDPDLLAHVRRAGARLLAGLQAVVEAGDAAEARGRGLMCAIDLIEPRAADGVRWLLEEGILANNTTPRTIRFLPPLVISEAEIDRVVDAVARMARAFAGGAAAT